MEKTEKKTWAEKWEAFRYEHESLALGIKVTFFMLLYVALIGMIVGIAFITAWSLVVTIPILCGVIIAHAHSAMEH